MTSIESLREMVRRLDDQIEELRTQEVDIMREMNACEETLEFDKQWIEEIREEKAVYLHTKVACLRFINEGGGLDMFVD